MKRNLRIFNNSTEVIKELADEFVNISNNNENPKINISLSGGSTPVKLFEMLSSEPYFSKINWDRLHLG